MGFINGTTQGGLKTTLSLALCSKSVSDILLFSTLLDPKIVSDEDFFILGNVLMANNGRIFFSKEKLESFNVGLTSGQQRIVRKNPDGTLESVPEDKESILSELSKLTGYTEFSDFDPSKYQLEKPSWFFARGSRIFDASYLNGTDIEKVNFRFSVVLCGVLHVDVFAVLTDEEIFFKTCLFSGEDMFRKVGVDGRFLFVEANPYVNVEYKGNKIKHFISCQRAKDGVPYSNKLQFLQIAAEKLGRRYARLFSDLNVPIFNPAGDSKNVTELGDAELVLNILGVDEANSVSKSLEASGYNLVNLFEKCKENGEIDKIPKNVATWVEHYETLSKYLVSHARLIERATGSTSMYASSEFVHFVGYDDTISGSTECKLYEYYPAKSADAWLFQIRGQWWYDSFTRELLTDSDSKGRDAMNMSSIFNLIDYTFNDFIANYAFLAAETSGPDGLISSSAISKDPFFRFSTGGFLSGKLLFYYNDAGRFVNASQPNGVVSEMWRFLPRLDSGVLPVILESDFLRFKNEIASLVSFEENYLKVSSWSEYLSVSVEQCEKDKSFLLWFLLNQSGAKFGQVLYRGNWFLEFLRWAVKKGSIPKQTWNKLGLALALPARGCFTNRYTSRNCLLELFNLAWDPEEEKFFFWFDSWYRDGDFAFENRGTDGTYLLPSVANVTVPRDALRISELRSCSVVYPSKTRLKWYI